MDYNSGSAHQTLYQRPPTTPVGDHIQILGILRIVWGCLGLPVGLSLVVMFGGISVLLGSAGGADAAAASGFIALFGLFIGAMFLAASIPSIIIGVGLLRRREWARVGALVLGVLELFHFPLGTALGAYSLWALTRPEAASQFH